MIVQAQCRCRVGVVDVRQILSRCRGACRPYGNVAALSSTPHKPRHRSIKSPVRASLSSMAIASAQIRNPHYSVSELLDSPWGYVALMMVPIGLYLMFKILLWDYRSRRTDDPNNPNRAQSFSLTSRPGPGQMPQSELPTVTHVVRDPELQAMATLAAHQVADAVRQAKATYEGELKLRNMNNDHVGAMEWDWVWSMLQPKDGKLAANAELLERAQQQVKRGKPASSTVAVSTMLAEVVAEQQALKQVQHMCNTLVKS